MDRAAFNKIIEAASAAYEHTLEPDTVDVYWRALRDCDADDAKQRLANHIKTEKFFPRISDLRPTPRPQLGHQQTPAKEIADERARANAYVARAIMDAGGVDHDTLRLMREVAIACAEDGCFDEIEATLADIARKKDRARLAQETEEARHAFCIKAKIPYIPATG